MSNYNFVDMANFLIDRRGEDWSIELEAKVVAEVEACDHMHETWQAMMSGRSAVVEGGEVKVLLNNPTSKIEAGLSGAKQASAKPNSMRPVGNTNFEVHRAGISRINAALSQGLLDKN